MMAYPIMGQMLDLQAKRWAELAAGCLWGSSGNPGRDRVIRLIRRQPFF
jgi:hypothetical protein